MIISMVSSFQGRGVHVGCKVDVAVGTGVLVGVTGFRGLGVLVGVAVGNSTIVGVINISCGYNSSMADFQDNPPLFIKRLNLAAG